LKQRMMEVEVTTGDISRAKLQSNHHHQQINTQFFTARMPFPSPNTNSVKALKGKISHSKDLLTPNSPGGVPTLSLTTNSSWLFWGGLPRLSSGLRCHYPICSLGLLKEKFGEQILTGLMIFLMLNKQHPSTEGECARSFVDYLDLHLGVAFIIGGHFCNLL